jgi:hypothetical protein
MKKAAKESEQEIGQIITGARRQRLYKRNSIVIYSAAQAQEHEVFGYYLVLRRKSVDDGLRP